MLQSRTNVTYQLRWFYHRDVSDNGVGDYFALDNIQIRPKVVLGDVNGDGQVNPTDATVLINALLNENFSTISTYGADMDGNGIINVTDAIQLINYLLTL